MTLYVVDTTLQPPQEKRFPDYPTIVKYLEGMSERAYRQTRKDRMNLLESLGHGEDDRQSISFVRSMATQFEMGIIRNNAGAINKMKCDITSIMLYQKPEFGD